MLMALPLWLVVSVDGRRSQRRGPSPALGSLGPSHPSYHKSRVSLWGPSCAHGVSDIPHGKVCHTLTLMDFTLWLNLNTEASHLVRHTWNMPFFASKKNSIQCNMNVVHINQYGCLKIGMIHTIWSSRCSCKFNWQCNMHMVVNNML